MKFYNKPELAMRKKLVFARNKAGLTPKQLGELAGLDTKTVNQTEKSIGTATDVRTLNKYLGALGYKLDVVEAD
ncbi:MAG: helix-turn-helix domain-containing protein [Defluviitaleaceae bacterium]|nr:helix-turn-helix domain-containing protein [Defluviitaleaceae bacterium]